MTVVERVAGVWFGLLEASALALADLTARVSTRRRLVAVEGGGGDLVLYAADKATGPALGRLPPPGTAAAGPVSRLLRHSHVTLDLDPGRFVFRTLDLPGRATDFIEAIVRTQIDRLTPWPPDQVVFGWSPPVAGGGDGSISLTIAGTDKAFVLPLMAAMQARGAAVVEARVPLPAGAGATLVIARTTAAAFAVAFWRRCLGIATAAVVALVIASSLYGQFAAMQLAAVAEELDREGAAKRAEIVKAAGDNDPAAVPRRIVAERRAAVPFATLVLEAVSRIVPDDSFVTNFEITGTQLRLVGFTADAPALIRLIAASGMFTGASFFAPTTRLPEDPGDRFSIEATIRPAALVP